MRTRNGVLLLAFLLVSCARDPTQLVVLVDTDYVVPAELARVRASVLDAERQEVSSQEFVLTDAPSPDDPTRFGVPFSFGIVPAGNDASRRITVELVGSASDGRARVMRRARTGFIEGQTLLLPMFLSRSCEGVECPDDQTCENGVCIDATRDPSGLISVRPGEELRFDGGPRRDGGIRDAASLDGQPPSDGPAADATTILSCGLTTCTCNRGYCDMTCAEPAMCVTVCNATGCAVHAAGSMFLDATCGPLATCEIDASGSSNVQAACEPGSSCDVDCTGAMNCDVDCQPSAMCLVQCTGSPSCRYRACAAGAPTSCPGGELACGRGCP